MSEDNVQDQEAAKPIKKKTAQKLVVSNQCKNCGHHLFLDQRFCPACGAKRIHNRLTARNLLEDFAERFLNIENVFLKTFLDLFKKPEDVINGYVDGVRKKYMSAFSYFAVAITITSLYTFFFRNWFLGGENLSMFSEGLAASSQNADGQFGMEVVDFLFDYQSFFSFLNIPFYALISKLVFWNYKKYNFIEHLVIYLYTYSQFQILSSIIGILFIWSDIAQMLVGLFTSVVPIFYTAYVLYRVFDLTLEKIILKTLLFFVILLPLTCIFFAITGGVMYSFGILDPFIENVTQQVETAKASKKAAQEAAKAIKDSIATDTLRVTIDRLKDTLQLLKPY